MTADASLPVAAPCAYCRVIDERTPFGWTVVPRSATTRRARNATRSQFSTGTTGRSPQQGRARAGAATASGAPASPPPPPPPPPWRRCIVVTGSGRRSRTSQVVSHFKLNSRSYYRRLKVCGGSVEREPEPFADLRLEENARREKRRRSE